MRLVVLGNGQLGTALGALGGEHTTILNREMVDVRREEQVRRVLAPLAPDTVINATAYNRVDAAETDAAEAFAVNAIAPGALARATHAIGARFVHVSTNYVFSGTHSVPYAEDAIPAPLGIYGASKLAGEHLTFAYAPDSLVVRTSSVFGAARPTGGNFVLAILRQAREGLPVRVVADATIAPTYSVDLAQAIFELLSLNAMGLVHVTNSGTCTWFEFACEILAQARLQVPIERVTTAAGATGARRPSYSVLDLSRLDAFGISMPDWREALARYLSEPGERRH